MDQIERKTVNLLAHFESVHHENNAAYMKAREIISHLLLAGNISEATKVYWNGRAELFLKESAPVLANPFVLKLEGEKGLTSREG